jgi:hypothetical protein
MKVELDRNDAHAVMYSSVMLPNSLDVPTPLVYPLDLARYLWYFAPNRAILYKSRHQKAKPVDQ